MSDTAFVSNQTDKLCPLQTFGVSGTTATGTKCITSACQLWVANRASDDKLRTLVGSNNPNGSLEDGTASLEDGGRCGLQVSDYAENIFRIQHHLHRHHEHPYAHSSAKKIPFLDGGYFFGGGIPRAFQLIQEMQIGEDTDGNGKVYGKDFEIDTNDDGAPMVLVNMGNVYNNKSNITIKWDDYVNNYFPPQVKSIYPSKWHFLGGARVRVIGAFFDGTKSLFSIKIGGNDGTPEVTVDPNTINIVSPTKLFFTSPPYPASYGFDNEVQMTFHNHGDTFDMFGDFFDFLTNTGGDTIVKKKIRFQPELDDSEIQAIIAEDEASYS